MYLCMFVCVFVYACVSASEANNTQWSNVV